MIYLFFDFFIIIFIFLIIFWVYLQTLAVSFVYSVTNFIADEVSDSVTKRHLQIQWQNDS